MKPIHKTLIYGGLGALVLSALFCYLFIGEMPEASSITWGVNFSQAQAESLRLDWKTTYLALLSDLGAKHVKLHIQWSNVEPVSGLYDFSDTDWQVQQAAEHGADVIYILGMKSGRWPECHAPAWTGGLEKEKVQDALLAYTKATVERYKGNPAIKYWQVENEPFFVFGNCPDWYYTDRDVVRKEVELVKALDPSREVIISDSGEGSLWFTAAQLGDIVGTTMYRQSWISLPNETGFSLRYHLSPAYYYWKALLIHQLFGKKVLCIELQAEPWAQAPFHLVPLAEQEKTMNVDIFKDNVQFAKQTGLDTFYFWGAEWWYWLTSTQNQPDIWNAAKAVFQN